ncbi:MAG: hypothetical protein AYK23_03035 [Candidatus Proteinoplasmatales archaeon SG8-5]|nr:MAG: hypothetical protein AYK23_03035 [Candidatus Proteinoplasmatales archaeon SG8-5]
MIIESACGKDIQTLWAKNFDTIDLNLSVNRRGRTRSLKITVDPDDEFEVGADIEIDGKLVFIHSIKTDTKRVRKGTAIAREILRVYCTEKGRR